MNAQFFLFLSLSLFDLLCTPSSHTKPGSKVQSSFVSPKFTSFFVGDLSLSLSHSWRSQSFIVVLCFIIISRFAISRNEEDEEEEEEEEKETEETEEQE